MSTYGSGPGVWGYFLDKEKGLSGSHRVGGPMIDHRMLEKMCKIIVEKRIENAKFSLNFQKSEQSLEIFTFSGRILQKLI